MKDFWRRQGVYLKLLATAFFWGGTFIAGRFLAKKVPTFSAAFLRFFVAFIFILGVTLRKEGRLPRPKKGELLRLILLGATGVFSYNVCFFKGLALIEAGRASLIIALNPILIALFSAILYREKLSGPRCAGILISVAGAVVVISKGKISTILSGSFGLGETYIVGCVLSWVAYSLIGKALLGRLSPLICVTYSILFGALLLFPLALNEGLMAHLFSYGPLSWISLIYLGLCGTVIGFVWYYDGIRRIGPTNAGQFINFVPVSAMVLAYLLLDEPITLALLCGAVCVILGSYLTNRPTGRASINPVTPDAIKEQAAP
jgi:drug/metabolite transporter (DMT)-like permease